MKIVVVVTVVMLGGSAAWADAPVCKASSDCGPNAVCTAEGKCIEVAAKPPPPPPVKQGPSDDDIAKAKLHFDQGVALFNDANFASALAEFLASYKLNPVAGLLKNIGLTQQRLFLYVDALESFQGYLDKLPDAPDVAEVKQIMTEIRALLVEVKLTTKPPTGVTITIDGKEVGKAPLARPLLIATGTRSIEVSAPGYKPQKRDLMVASGVPIDLTFELELIPTTGKVRISSPIPRATVTIDGKPVGIVPLEIELTGGGHTLEVVAPGHSPHRGELVVTVGQVREVAIPLDKIVVARREKPWYRKWYITGPIGAAVVGVGVGTVLFVTATPDPIGGTLAPGAGKIR